MKVVVLLCCGERKVKEEKCLFTSSGRGFILAGLKNLIDMIDSFIKLQMSRVDASISGWL